MQKQTEKIHCLLFTDVKHLIKSYDEDPSKILYTNVQ